ncbi:hypothetical protein GGG87_08615 [Streptococcus sp. zg-86]|uniref:DUF6287 domain-containing protein n=1 Tax=Streptococcus zhangguiae TaxID=2664091 RepID=A0A6I4RGK1_9STRE|nr:MULTISPECIES: DUF6287 domain-containing protein [unclassified Streptococcus]MTB65056.1 hypothetical protein [Streptococcus sp. zg-86]MTB91257.1 hypothetical protein [Streptococcus sp. zg-36]MWV57030.1 hypothetical protein [Streptococcus sp. zg-70]QTH47548.1 hypothetical protein J5M87_08405 [Streptococcus sp. zg-86]
MKQIAKLSHLALISLLTSALLTACTTNKVSQTSTSEQTSQSTATSGEVKKSTPKNDKKSYASIFEDYQKILEYNATYHTNLAHIQELLGSLNIELNSWVIESALYSPDRLRYTFLDVNQDGQNELLVGSSGENQQIFPVALYYLENKTPNLLAEGFVAGHGGARNAFTIYQNGDVVTASWSSGTGAGTATLYQFSTNSPQPKQGNQTEFQLGQDKLDQLFGKSKAEELDLTALNWASFETPQKPASAIDTTAKNMDINAVSAGDFSSLAGTWKNGKGRVLTIQTDGTVNYQDVPDRNYHINLNYANIENGQLTAGIRNPDAMASAIVPTVFIPKGVAITPIAENASDPTDQTKDRLFSTQYLMPADILAQEVFYRVEE